MVVKLLSFLVGVTSSGFQNPCLAFMTKFLQLLLRLLCLKRKPSTLQGILRGLQGGKTENDINRDRIPGYSCTTFGEIVFKITILRQTKPPQIMDDIVELRIDEKGKREVVSRIDRGYTAKNENHLRNFDPYFKGDAAAHVREKFAQQREKQREKLEDLDRL